MTSPLKALRVSRGLTLMDVARGTGLDTGQLSRIERGTQRSLTGATKLVAFFGKGITEVEILYPERYASEESGTGKAPAAV